MTELAAWLEKIGLGQYAPVLAANDVDVATLPYLTDDDLKELGLSLGHRRRLLAAVYESSGTEPAPGAARTRKIPVEDPVEDAERRQLTVMFCDLVGSTELSQRVDPEELREVLRRYHDAVTGAVAAHHGHVAKLLGDGVLAYFGWPTAHENDAENAILAALAAVDAVPKITVGGAPLAARAGIATGPVVIGDMRGETAEERGSVAGATPNLAARLQDAAAPGTVMIHAATRRLVGSAFELEKLGPRDLKGFAQPVVLWRVIRTSRSGSRFEAMHGGGLTQFVGRVQDIGLLLDRWHLAQGGEGQVVLLSGEAGIGKSRILREFTEHLTESGCRVLRYQCSPHDVNAAFHPLVAEIEDTAGLVAEGSAENRLDRLERHLTEAFPALPPDAAAVFAPLLGLPVDRYPPVEMAPQRRKQRIISLLVERVAGLARERPAVLLFEDIHWADPSSLEFLDALVARVQEFPVLVVMAYRPEFQPRWGGHGHVTVHSLNRLSRTDGRTIAERIAGGKALPTEVLDRIVKQTDGIPLFVEELTKTVLETGVLEELTDRYVLTGPLPALAIPTTLQDSLMARLDKLSTVRRVVQAAACIGREFGAGLLSAALPMSNDELKDALDRLVEAELIFRHGGTGDEPRFIFKHALVQDAAYASLVTAARRALHKRLSMALEEAEDPDPLELARHLLAAGKNERASVVYLEAGRRSLEASALPEAIGALELGLQAAGELAASTDRNRIELDLRVALGTARMANFGWAHPSVSEAMEPAFPLARTLGIEEALVSILWALWVHYQTRADFPRAHEWLAELAAVAAEKPQSDLPLISDMSAGCQCFWEADYPRALGHTDRLRAVYDPSKHASITRLTNHDPLVFSQHWAGSLADWISGRPERSVQRMDEAVTLAREIGHPFNLVFALTAGATALVYLNETARLLAYCDEAARVVTEEVLGPFSDNVLVMQWRGAAHVMRGDFEQGYALVKRGNDFWTDSGGRICTAMFRSWIVLGLMGLARVDEAAALNAANIEHCRRTGDRYMEPECVRLAGELALAGNGSDVEGAERLFHEAIAIAQSQGARSWELRATMSLARLLQTRDRRGEAIASLEQACGRLTEGFETADSRQATALLESLD